MENKDWEEIFHLIQVQKNIQRSILNEVKYATSSYWVARGNLSAYETCEQYIQSRLTKKGE